MSKSWATPVAVQYKVNFYSGGDTTRDAFSKHIQELERIYGLLNALDTAKVSASDVSSLTSTISSLNSRINNLDQKIDDTNQEIGNIDVDAINQRIDDLEDEVEKNKPVTLKYRIMEQMFSPIQKDPSDSSNSLIQDTWIKGTDARLSYSSYGSEADYRVFTVPNGVYKLVIDACGGGGGGYMNGDTFVCGGNASSLKNFIYDVTPGDKLYVYPGRGGSGWSKSLNGSGLCSDGEDTEVKLGSSSSTASTATQIIYCYGGYGAENIDNNSPTNKLPTVAGYSSGGTRYYQTPARIAYLGRNSYDTVRILASGFSSESTLIPPYGAGGAFNTTWSRSNNYTGTYGVVVIRYVGIY